MLQKERNSTYLFAYSNWKIVGVWDSGFVQFGSWWPQKPSFIRHIFAYFRVLGLWNISVGNWEYYMCRIFRSIFIFTYFCYFKILRAYALWSIKLFFKQLFRFFRMRRKNLPKTGKALVSHSEMRFLKTSLQNSSPAAHLQAHHYTIIEQILKKTRKSCSFG
jgi:hypothetical protein